MVTYLDSLSTQKVDILFFWPKDLSGLAERLADLQDQIDPDVAIWVVMPKKKYAGARGIDFTWEEMQAAGLSTDLVDNKVASINDVEYGTRFVIRKERREKYRLA
jgi:16S rRNA G1207 methylase RsmC